MAVLPGVVLREQRHHLRPPAGVEEGSAVWGSRGTVSSIHPAAARLATDVLRALVDVALQPECVIQ